MSTCESVDTISHNRKHRQHASIRPAVDAYDLRAIVQQLNAKDVAVHFVKENLTFRGGDDAMSILMLNIMGSFAEFELSLIRSRQAEGIRIASTKY